MFGGEGGPGQGSRRSGRPALDGRRGCAWRQWPPISRCARNRGRRGARWRNRGVAFVAEPRWRLLRGAGGGREQHCGARGAMRAAHAVSDVRAAERALMALVPDGALMQRAAAGLASVCAGMLGRVYGARVVVLAGRGDNGGDALFAGARLAGRGARGTAVPAGTEVHPAGAAALRQAGGLVMGAADAGAGAEAATATSVGAEAAGAIADAELIIDGILGIGGRGGLREPAATLAGLTAAAAGAG